MFALDHPKLATLAEYERYSDPMKLLEDNVTDGLCPAICMNEGCDATATYEPDQTQGYCEACGTGSMQSALIIAGMI